MRLIALFFAGLMWLATPVQGATYLELRNLGNDPDLRNRVQVAVIVAAQLIGENAATETTERKAWAQRVIRNPTTWAERALWLALADNKDLTVADIQNATDAQLQAVIDAMVDLMALGLIPGE